MPRKPPKPPASSGWSFEQGLMVTAIVVILGGGAIGFYPIVVAHLEAMKGKGGMARGSGESGCAATADTQANAKTVFCTANSPPGTRPLVSTVDTPLGSIPNLDHAFDR